MGTLGGELAQESLMITDVMWLLVSHRDAMPHCCML